MKLSTGSWSPRCFERAEQFENGRRQALRRFKRCIYLDKNRCKRHCNRFCKRLKSIGRHRWRPEPVDQSLVEHSQHSKQFLLSTDTSHAQSPLISINRNDRSCAGAQVPNKRNKPLSQEISRKTRINWIWKLGKFRNWQIKIKKTWTTKEKRESLWVGSWSCGELKGREECSPIAQRNQLKRF